MRPSFGSRLAAVALLCASSSLPWVAGAHLHLCFDGLEPPATLHHLADGGDHQNHHSPESGHIDSDVEFDTSLTRAPTDGGDAPAISMRVANACASVGSKTFLRPTQAPSGACSVPRFRLPPLRAPPA
jgi:hypothetical protein